MANYVTNKQSFMLLMFVSKDIASKQSLAVSILHIVVTMSIVQLYSERYDPADILRAFKFRFAFSHRVSYQSVTIKLGHTEGKRAEKRSISCCSRYPPAHLPQGDGELTGRRRIAGLEAK